MMKYFVKCYELESNGNVQEPCLWFMGNKYQVSRIKTSTKKSRRKIACSDRNMTQHKDIAA